MPAAKLNNRYYLRMKLKSCLIIGICLFIIYLIPAAAQTDSIPDYTYTKIGHGHFLDNRADVSQPYLDFDFMTIQLAPDSINISMTFMNIPGYLTFNQRKLPVNALNFSWSVVFDIDNSDSMSAGDIFLSISKFKLREGETKLDILGATQHDLWVAGEDGKGAANEADIEHIQMNGNSVVIRVPRSLHRNLAKINADTNVRFEAVFNDGETVFRDMFPNE